MSAHLDTPISNTAEREAVIRTAGLAPDEDWVIVTRGIQRDYDMGGEVVHALRGVDVAIRRNEYVAIMGPSGSGKSTLMNLIGCLDTPTAGEYWLNGMLVSDMSDDELARVRNREIGFVFQTFNLLPRATALHNVELPLVYAGVPSQERKRQGDARRWSACSSETVPRTDPTSYRAVSGSASRLRARWSTSRRFFWPTSRPVTSTRERQPRSCASSSRLATEGQTVIMVTHEADIAAHAGRIVVLRDGRISSDERRDTFAQRVALAQAAH